MLIPLLSTISICILSSFSTESKEAFFSTSGTVGQKKPFESTRPVFVFGPESRIPSPFTHNLILSVYDDVVGITDKKALLENLYEIVNNRINQKNNGKLLK